MVKPKESSVDEYKILKQAYQETITYVRDLKHITEGGIFYNVSRVKGLPFVVQLFQTYTRQMGAITEKLWKDWIRGNKTKDGFYASLLDDFTKFVTCTQNYQETLRSTIEQIKTDKDKFPRKDENIRLIKNITRLIDSLDKVIKYYTRGGVYREKLVALGKIEEADDSSYYSSESDYDDDDDDEDTRARITALLNYS